MSYAKVVMIPVDVYKNILGGGGIINPMEVNLLEMERI